VPSQLDEPTWKLALRALVRFALVSTALFGSAGRLDWPRGWFFCGLVAVTLFATLPVFHRENPRLLRTRLEKPRGVNPFDRLIYFVLMLCLLGCLSVAGFTARFGWRTLDFEWTYLGVVLYVAGVIPIGLAVANNPFVEPILRIQSERGHVPVTSGPYRIIRHPMYAGIVVLIGSWPLLLGAAWSYVPWALLVVTIVIRTALEDRTLRRELAGYEEYAKRTRFRLIPELW